MACKILHIALASLLWLSSTGLVLNKHFCQDILRDTALFAKAENCHSRIAREESDMPKSCPMHAAKAANEEPVKGCCDDTAEYLQLDDNVLKTNPTKLDFQLPLLIAYAWKLAEWSSYDFNPITVDYLNYKPPLLVCDLSISLQTFRL